MAPRKDQNWLELPPFSEDFAAAAIERFEESQNVLKASRRHQRMRRSWMMRYSRSADSGCDESEINTGGEREELTFIAPNFYNRMINDQVTLVEQTPSEPEPEALNNDAESKAQCQLARNIINHYKRRARLDDMRSERADVCLTLSESFLHVRWDPEAGDIHGYEDVPEAVEEATEPVDNSAEEAAEKKQPKQRPIYTGDFVFDVCTPYEVAYAPTTNDRAHPAWWIVRTKMLRWDVLAKFGGDSEEIRTAILNAEPWTHFTKAWDYEQVQHRFDDMIAVYWVYGEPCSSLPNGRKSLVLNSKIVLLDSELDEERAGVFRLSESDVIFRNEGHTRNFDGMAVCKALHATYTTILSNQSTWGLNRILAARKANLKATALDTGLARVDYDHFDVQSGAAVPEPKVMQVLDTKRELFESIQMFQKTLDTVMVGSPVTRGDPEATKGSSGSHAALLYSSAQQAASGFVKRVQRSDEEIYSFIISSLRRHATVPRLVMIAGKANTYTAEKFVGEDLAQVSRVPVRNADPARDTFAGRMQQAEMLFQLPPDQRHDAQQLLLTGRVESVTEKLDSHQLLIDREDDWLRDGSEPVQALDTDRHAEHMQSHAALKDDPAIRRDPAALARIDKHIAEHVAKLTPDHPDFAGIQVLMLTGQQPLPPMSMPVVPPPDGETGEPPEHGEHAGAPKPPEHSKPEAPNGPPQNMPKMPMNAATGQRVPLPAPGAPAVG